MTREIAENYQTNESRVMKEPISENTIIFHKEEFVSIIEKLRDSFDLVEMVDELFYNSRENVECDFCNGAGLQISHEGIVVLLLKKLMKDEADWIDYFIYDLDYGRKYAPGIVKDKKGNNVDLSSAEKLYDYICGMQH